MALTAAERQRRRREKLKLEGKYDDFKKKHCSEEKKSYLKKKRKLQELPRRIQEKLKREKKLAIKNRVAKHRKLKHDGKLQTPTEFPSVVAFRKAISRAKKNLPSTPRRRKLLVRKLFQMEGETQASNDFPIPRLLAISDETTCLVKLYFERDDISRQAPGRKDVVSIREISGSKVKLQARHLMSSVNEVYSMFKTEYPNVKIGKSKFAELRPKNVLLSNKLPHNVCLCKYHENFINAIAALSKAVVKFPPYSKDFPETLLCERKSRDCWINKCEQCQNGKIFLRNIKNIIEDENEPIKWFVWKSESCDQRISKVVEEGTVEELTQYICSLIPSFLEHCYTKRKQAQASFEEKEYAVSKTYDKEKALIQVDFSENYTCISQDEIQSAHWNQCQVSLFTSCLWYSGVLHPVVIVSDNINHSKDTVVAYIDKLLEEIPDKIQEISIWSDGPASQFKNRYVAASISALQDKHEVSITWNFFATSHGKGPVDGVGGAVKRQVWDLVKKRTFTVQSAAEFAEAANKSKVKVVEMTAAEILKRNKNLNLDSVFKNASLLSGISKFHCLKIQNGEPIGFLLTQDKVVEHGDCAIEDKIKIGDWYEVEYEKKLYPGEIQERSNLNEYLVSAMEPVGQYWKWPSQEDKVFYKRDKLIRKLCLPILVNSRGHYKFCV